MDAASRAVGGGGARKTKQINFISALFFARMVFYEFKSFRANRFLSGKALEPHEYPLSFTNGY